MKNSVSWPSRHAILLTALAVTALFSLRFLHCLPFSGNTRPYNFETITTITSLFIYNREPLSFPLGAIKGLTFPFQDANAGNVGGIPLFAVPFKILGRAFPYFQTFDFFILLEILSCFLVAIFSQKILRRLGVSRHAFLIFAALATATSFLILNRSAWLQPFCVASFPLFTGWLLAMLVTLEREKWNFKQDTFALILFPIAALSDNYTLVGMLLGTGILAVREGFEYFFGGMPASGNRLSRLLFYCVGGSALGLFGLFLVGMYPIPKMTSNFTSYDFGMGGRHHVADLLAPWIPVTNKVHGFVHESILGKIGLPFNTDHLGNGQYEGVGFVGTAIILLWVCLAIAGALSFARNSKAKFFLESKLVLYSPWKKVALAALFVFLFSLGYELHIYGVSFPNFSGMPAAWIADRFPSLYNIRAPGRLTALFSLFLILEGVRRMSLWFEKKDGVHSRKAVVALVFLSALHILEVGPFLKPLPSSPILPLGTAFTEEEIQTLQKLAKGRNAALIAPGAMAADGKWTKEIFVLSYYLGIPTNLFSLARYEAEHFYAIERDLARISSGSWDELSKQYGDILFAIPLAQADALRPKVQNKYLETKIGPVSIWSSRFPIVQKEQL